MEFSNRETVSRILADPEFDVDGAKGGEILPLVYDELRAIARRFMRDERPGHTLQPTAVVHEAYLRLVDESRVNWQGRTHFRAVCAKVMRRVLIDYARARKREKRGGGDKAVLLDTIAVPLELGDIDALELHDAIDRLSALDARQARVVELRYFGGLSVEEVAEMLGVSRRTVESEWTHAKAWLRVQLSRNKST